MKTNLFITVILLFHFLSDSAQQTLSFERNLPRSGDKIEKQQVEYKDPGRAGDNVIWNFSNLKSINEKYSLVYSAPEPINGLYIMGLDTFPVDSVGKNELLIGNEHSTIYYYRFLLNRLWILGYENSTSILKYSKPLLAEQYPLAVGENYSENYSLEGLYSSVYPVSGKGSVTICSDAYGVIILPSDDTIKDVTRLKSNRNILKNDEEIYVENYRWFARGYRYPIFETVKITTENNETFSSAFFYPPEKHYYLNDDSDNTGIKSIIDSRQGKIAYNFFPNPVSEILNMEFYFPEKTNVKIQLVSLSGSVILNENRGQYPSGLNRLQLNFPPVSAGNYILIIHLDGSIISEIITKK
ncbi:MAG: T9SS type A sorting domain-containing protein [Dysgonamonadaceae bacterium]|jgi:hypothetical protein|nr:T9SS type A sorting domain-containing protein [Dysgonamonadaceae bacterium]